MSICVFSFDKIFWKVEFERITPWAFSCACSVMSAVFYWCCGDIPILKDLKLNSQAGPQQWYLHGEYSAEGSLEEVWSQTAVSGWFENSHSVFWKTVCVSVCDVNIAHLNLKTQKYSISEVIVKLFSLQSHFNFLSVIDRTCKIN